MVALLLVPLMVGRVAMVVQPGTSTPPLRNAADPGVVMPYAGLGMPCGPTYQCGQSAYEGTLTFLALGGRHTDSADSYTGAEPGIGLAMREWMAGDAANRREDLFIASKIGPGGACWPLGYNESINQAKMILDYYNQLPSPMPTPNITQLDLLLIHWPINCGPCAVGSAHGHCPRTIPTTDPACDVAQPTYDEKGCRISTWRGMIVAWKLGLTRSIGVSNWKTTEMQDLKDAGLPLPSVTQIQWTPGWLQPTKKFTPYNNNETFSQVRAWCDEHGVLVTGYSPFGGNGHAGATFANPSIQAVATRHNVSAAQVVLRWNVQLGIPVIPQATNPTYQAENLDIFGFTLSASEMECIGTLSPSACPPPPPPPPPPPLTPTQLKCEFSLLEAVQNLQHGASATISLKSLPPGPFNLTDRLKDRYLVLSPCRNALDTTSPALETWYGTAGKITLGLLSQLRTQPLPTEHYGTGAEGMRLILGGGNGNPGCNRGRILQYDMVCDKSASANAGPNTTMFIYEQPPRKVDPVAICTYRVVWRTPAACPV
jgi:diketogulonate reductase-like aldo/keto reductase|eukprot:COSAG02_NODE_616_length_19505_cov_5.004998_7_plen_541_part_00